MSAGNAAFNIPTVCSFAANIVSTVGRPEFPDNLVECLSELIDFDLFCFTAFPKGGDPVLLHHNLLGYTTAAVLDAYCKGAYERDPLYDACRTGVGDGVYFFAEDHGQRSLSSLADEALHPCISMNANSLSGEAAYIAHFPAFSIMCSLMRSPGLSAFDDEEIIRMASLEPIVSSSLGRQFSNLAPAHGAQRKLSDKEFAGILARIGGDVLSARERTIVAMILEGHTSNSISHTLDISEGTVKNHRKNIYRKLRIGSQVSLFHRFFGPSAH